MDLKKSHAPKSFSSSGLAYMLEFLFTAAARNRACGPSSIPQKYKSTMNTSRQHFKKNTIALERSDRRSENHGSESFLEDLIGIGITFPGSGI